MSCVTLEIGLWFAVKRKLDPIVRLGMVKTLWRSLRPLPFLLVVLACFCMGAHLHAKPRITYEIKEVAKHKMLVTFTWDVTIDSDKPWDGCDLKISFHDGKGNEIYSLKEAIALKVGRNSFSGTEICSVEIWKRVAKYVATLDCLF